MKIGLWPFYSQQDKSTGRFRLDTCGATKQAKFIEEQLHELGHKVVAAVPREVEHPFRNGAQVSLPTNNAHQCVHWNTNDIKYALEGCDVAVLWHEFMAIPVRAVYPSMRIVQICAVNPRTENATLFELAWKRADTVVVQTETARKYVGARTRQPVDVWSMAYDMRNILPSQPKKDIDVLFVQRCSSTNYTRHVEFVAALDAGAFEGLNVVFVDVTGYLKRQRPDLSYTTPDSYFDALSRAKVAVALNDDLFGGQAIREAIVSGCVPVTLDAPCYRELCSNIWMYCVRLDLSDLVDKVKNAVIVGADMDNTICFTPHRNAALQSYQKAWEAVRCTILR